MKVLKRFSSGEMISFKNEEKLLTAGYMYFKLFLLNYEKFIDNALIFNKRSTALSKLLDKIENRIDPTIADYLRNILNTTLNKDMFTLGN